MPGLFTDTPRVGDGTEYDRLGVVFRPDGSHDLGSACSAVFERLESCLGGPGDHFGVDGVIIALVYGLTAVSILHRFNKRVIGALGEAFENQNNGVTFTYNPTGSASGIQAVQEGRCDIGLSSRNLKEEEAADGLEATILAYDGIAVIVNPQNPVTDLDVETIAGLYTGEITNWKDVGGNDAPVVPMVKDGSYVIQRPH